MLTARRVILLLLALAIIAGVFALKGEKGRPEGQDLSTQFEQHQEPPPADESLLASFSGSAVNREPDPASHPPKQPETSPTQTPTNPIGFGTIGGSVFDRNGKPLARHRVAFCAGKDINFSERVTALSDENGYFLLEHVPAGRWHAVYIGPDVELFPSVLEFGPIEVQPDRLISFNFYLDGDRTLTGKLTLSEEDLRELGGSITDEIHLQLELRAKWDSDTIVARGVASTSLETHSKIDKASVGKSDLPNGHGASGKFRMSGIVPGVYTLRIIVGQSKNSRTGKMMDLYLEREVDLFEGDLELPAEEFTLAQFVEAALLRN